MFYKIMSLTTAFPVVTDDQNAIFTVNDVLLNGVGLFGTHERAPQSTLLHQLFPIFHVYFNLFQILFTTI